MTVKSLKHKFINPKADAGDTTIARPSNWNDDHSFLLGVNVQSGLSYTLVDSDAWCEVVFTDGSATGSIAVTLPQAGASGLFVGGWRTRVRHGGQSWRLLIITPNTSTINGNTSLILLGGQYADIYSDGTNYFAVIGETPSGINVLRNCKFDIWRRGTSGTMAAGGSGYIVDGWILNPTGAACPWGQLVQAPGNFGTIYTLTLTSAAGLTDTFLYQRIESFLAASLSNRRCTFQAIVFVSGTGGSVTPMLQVGHPGGSGIDNWTSTVWDITGMPLQNCGSGYTLLTYSFVAPNYDNGCVVGLDFGGALNGAGRVAYIIMASLASGQLAPPKYRDIVTEQGLCERYLPGYYSTDTGTRMICTGTCGTTTTASIPLPMRVRPRVTPATPFAVAPVPGNFQVYTGPTFPVCTAIGTAGHSTHAIDLEITVASGLTPGNAAVLHQVGTTGPWQLLVSGCEL